MVIKMGKFRIWFAWYHWYMGFSYNRIDDVLYIDPMPMICMRIELKQKNKISVKLSDENILSLKLYLTDELIKNKEASAAFINLSIPGIEKELLSQLEQKRKEWNEKIHNQIV